MHSGSSGTKGPFTLNDCVCESDITNNWVLSVSMELFTSSDITHQWKISFSQSLSVTLP